MAFSKACRAPFSISGDKYFPLSLFLNDQQNKDAMHCNVMAANTRTIQNLDNKVQKDKDLRAHTEQDRNYFFIYNKNIRVIKNTQ